jgi:hypothetical protein
LRVAAFRRVAEGKGPILRAGKEIVSNGCGVRDGWSPAGRPHAANAPLQSPNPNGLATASGAFSARWQDLGPKYKGT